MKTQKIWNIIYWGVGMAILVASVIVPSPADWWLVAIDGTFIGSMLTGYWLGARHCEELYENDIIFEDEQDTDVGN